LINGIPFEIKSIYGLEKSIVEGETAGESIEGVPEDTQS